MPPKKKAANGYKFAEPIPKGTILEDIGKKKWKLGPSIGKGGFGEIYSAQEESAKGEKYPYVVKIEPHSNGPLFVEINFYIRHAKQAEIEEFRKEKGLKTFGMPVYYGSGSLEYKKEKYRFLVMDKFSTDLYKLLVDNNMTFPVDTTFKIGLQIIDVLEYIHQKGYVHADIKAANLLLGATKETLNKQVYLVDFGLATKYTMEKEFKPNPKKAHDGTIEFLSRDAHQGVQTRRGDLEILAYNLIQWLGCKLPWESNLSDPKVVQNSKEEHMATVSKMVKACFKSKVPPKALLDYLNYLKTLKFNTEPDYKKIRTIFTAGVKEGKGTIGTPLQFSESKTPLKRTRTPLTNSRNKKVKPIEEEEEKNEDDNDDEEVTPKPKKRGGRKKKEELAEEEEEKNEDGNEDEQVTPRPKKKGGRKKKEEPAVVSEDVVMVEDDDVMETNGKFSDDEEVSKPKKRAPKKKKTVVQDEEDDITMVVEDDIMETNGNFNDSKEVSKLKKRAHKKKETVVSDEEGDIEMAEADSDNSPVINFVTKRKPAKTVISRKGLLDKRLSKSMDNLSNANNFDGYTDAMKEIMMKKLKSGGRKNKTTASKKKDLSPKEDEKVDDDEMVGFTEEMKAIALKKKAKIGRKVPALVPIATSSRANDKKGIVKPTSTRLRKRLPRSHGEVVAYSDGDVSE